MAYEDEPEDPPARRPLREVLAVAVLAVAVGALVCVTAVLIAATMVVVRAVLG